MKTEKEVYKKIVPIATPNHSSLQIFHGVALNERNSSTHSRSSFCIGKNIPLRYPHTHQSLFFQRDNRKNTKGKVLNLDKTAEPVNMHSLLAVRTLVQADTPASDT